MKQEFVERIISSDLILVGIGKEFEEIKYQCMADAIEALQKLKIILQGKNYFVITTCTNSILYEAGFEKERVVSPCGNMRKKQCPNKCEGSLKSLNDTEIEQIKSDVEVLEKGILGTCAKCGEELVLNNVYAHMYDENGYLDAWKFYTKWLQGTLNKKLCILELGVDLGFPTIIRWPFEKVAFYNQKAVLIRVNDKLYHIPEELMEKGISIASNAIDWIMEKEV